MKGPCCDMVVAHYETANCELGHWAIKLRCTDQEGQEDQVPSDLEGGLDLRATAAAPKGSPLFQNPKMGGLSTGS